MRDGSEIFKSCMEMLKKKKGGEKVSELVANVGKSIFRKF